MKVDIERNSALRAEPAGQRDADLRDVIGFALSLADKEDAWTGMGFLATWNWETDAFLRVHWPEFAEYEAAARCRAEGGGTSDNCPIDTAYGPASCFDCVQRAGSAPVAGTDKDTERLVPRTDDFGTVWMVTPEKAAEIDAAIAAHTKAGTEPG